MTLNYIIVHKCDWSQGTHNLVFSRGGLFLVSSPGNVLWPTSMVWGLWGVTRVFTVAT